LDIIEFAGLEERYGTRNTQRLRLRRDFVFMQAQVPHWPRDQLARAFVGQMNRFLAPGTVRAYFEHVFGAGRMPRDIWRVYQVVRRADADADHSHARDFEQSSLRGLLRRVPDITQRALIFTMLTTPSRHRDLRRLRGKQLRVTRNGLMRTQIRLAKAKHDRSERATVKTNPAWLGFKKVPADIRTFLNSVAEDVRPFAHIPLQSTNACLRSALPGATTYTLRRAYMQAVERHVKDPIERLHLTQHARDNTLRAYYAKEWEE